MEPLNIILSFITILANLRNLMKVVIVIIIAGIGTGCIDP